MNTPSSALPEPGVASGRLAAAAAPATRPLYWSVRRELWENRAIWAAPLVVAGIVLVAFAISAVGLPGRRRAVLLLDAAQQRAAIDVPYDVAAVMILLTAFITGVVYCVEALHGERRDRSVLFWKSMPVSDLTAVLAKAAIPCVVLPLVVFVVTVGLQLAMLAVSAAALALAGLDPTQPWMFPILPRSAMLLYGVVAMALWQAPIWGWLLLASVWAPRAAFLWAVLPPIAVAVVETMTLGTTHFLALLRYRLVGQFWEAFAFDPPGTLSAESIAQLTPGRFLATPGLWLGLVVATLLLAAAVRLRRYRGPI